MIGNFLLLAGGNNRGMLYTTLATAAATAADNEGDDVECPWLTWLAGERVV